MHVWSVKESKQNNLLWAEANNVNRLMNEEKYNIDNVIEN